MGLNFVKEIREEQLMSKAELARKAGVSPVTIDRVERGKSCRMETKRKIILALGYVKFKVIPSILCRRVRLGVLPLSLLLFSVS